MNAPGTRSQRSVSSSAPALPNHCVSRDLLITLLLVYAGRVTRSWRRPVRRGFPLCFAPWRLVSVSSCCCSSALLRSKRRRPEAAPCRIQVRRESRCPVLTLDGVLVLCGFPVFSCWCNGWKLVTLSKNLHSITFFFSSPIVCLLYNFQ